MYRCLTPTLLRDKNMNDSKTLGIMYPICALFLFTGCIRFNNADDRVCAFALCGINLDLSLTLVDENSREPLGNVPILVSLTDSFEIQCQYNIHNHIHYYCFFLEIIHD